MEAWRTIITGYKQDLIKQIMFSTDLLDDIWLNTKDNSLILVDYKSQANATQVSQENYFSVIIKWLSDTIRFL